MIWGKTLDPGKLYTEVVHADIHLSMAALESRTERGSDYNGYTQVILKTDEAEFLLCTLVHGVIFQQHLDVQLKKGEEISVFTQGKNKVHLTGYSIHIEDNMVTSQGVLEDTENRQDEDDIPRETNENDRVPCFPEGIETPVIKTEYPVPGEVFWPPLRPPGSFGLLPHLTTGLMRWGQRRFSYEQGLGRDTAEAAISAVESPKAQSSIVKTEPIDEPNWDSVTDAGHEKIYQESEEGVQYISEGEEDTQSPPPSAELMRRVEEPVVMRQLTSPPIIQRTQFVRERIQNQRNGEATKRSSSQQNHASRIRPHPTQLDVIPAIQAQVIQRRHLQNCENVDDLSKLTVPNPITGYQCQFCSKLFRNISNFKSHQLVHTDLKPHKCRFCGVGFKQTGNLKAHERIHTGDRPYKCSYCTKQFARSTTRNTHEKLHTGSVKYSCKHCSKVYMNLSSLKNHELLKHHELMKHNT